MQLHIRRYEAYLILGKAAPLPAHHWQVWQRIALLLDPLMAAARGRPGVRSHQIDLRSRKPVRFGRLGWDDRSHMAWTHDSPQTSGRSNGWYFASTTVYAPHWPVCVREDVGPDIYMHLASLVRRRQDGSDQGLLLAIYPDLRSRLATHAIEGAVGGIAAHMHSVLSMTQELSWGEGVTGHVGYTCAIEDFANLVPNELEAAADTWYGARWRRGWRPLADVGSS